MNAKLRHLIKIGTVLFSCLMPISAAAQIVPDNTLPDNSVVTPDGDVIQIDGGTTRGNNLFHSFQEFSVPVENEAVFNNAEAIENIFSRVTGGVESIIDGGIGANGAANLFLINPAGIIFGENSFLNVGGSFVGSTADNLLFPDNVEYSATDTDVEPVLTINAPIGLGFRDEPQPITNLSIFDLDNLVGLNVPADQTIALIGGDIFLDGGIISSDGGRIELGSVGANNTVGITEIEQGFDFDYEGITNFQDLNLTLAAFVESRGANTGDIEVQARNISLIEGSEIAINTSEGTAGNLIVNASESIVISGNAADVDFGDFESAIFNNVSESAMGEGSVLTIATDNLTLDNGGQITARTLGSGRGVDINVEASTISIGEPFVFDLDDFIFSGIFAQTDLDSTGDGGNITVQTERLAIDDGGQINTDTVGSGNGGNLLVDASEFIELSGVVPENTSTQLEPSALFSTVADEATATGNGGDLNINTRTLILLEGAQIGTFAQNTGNGGILTINATESIQINGFAPSAEFRGIGGISGIIVSAEPSFEDESGTIFPTTGTGGTLNLSTEELIVEEGGAISADTFSLGDGGDINLNIDRLTVQNGGEIRAGSLIGANPLDTERGAGGTLNINATESIEITGTGDINGETVNSSLLTAGESNGNAGSISLNSDNLSVNNGGLISAATNAGAGGNITLNVDRSIRLSNDSLISAAASGSANGGNINIDTALVIASPDGNNDIIASAGEQGTGGNINIDAESVFGLETRPQNDATNDIDATGGVDGQVIINTPDIDITQGVIEIPQNVVEAELTVAQVCRNDTQTGNTLVVQGKGGIPPEPTVTLNSANILIDDEATIQPQALQTAAGEIMLARGAIKTASGDVILTAYPTVNNRRVPQERVNCAG
ncbi:MAG: filamentous hemagglutinin N-terminal domain-containing protein [Cyanobacteria bacterium J06623_7]